MRHIQVISEEEMVAGFLQGELASSRFGPTIRSILERDSRRPSVIAEPDLAVPADNEYRAQILAEYRGYRRDEGLFRYVPQQVRWYRAQATVEDLARIRYVDYDYWTELSGGSRLAVDAAERIKAGIEAFGVSNEGFRDMAQALATGASFPEIIVVGPHEGGPLVALEGHMRLTAYFLAREHVPSVLTLIVGYAPGLERK